MTEATSAPPKPFSAAAIAALVLASLVAQLLPRNAAPSAPLARAIKREATVKKETLARIVKNVLFRIGHDNLMLVAAGCAFYSMTAIFPAIAAVVSIYGLFADPHAAQAQIASFSTLLPPEAMKLLNDSLSMYVNKSRATLNTALLVSVALAIWTSRAGISTLMTGLNIANERPEERGFFTRQFISLALTIGAILFASIALSAVALLPVLINVLPVGPTPKYLLEFGRWPLLAIVVALGLAVFYRFGSWREEPKWRWISWGAAIATLMWLAGSVGFSIYVSQFASYDKTYGSLAAPVILLLWFWVSSLVVLIGAEIDAELVYADGRRARPIDMSTAR